MTYSDFQKLTGVPKEAELVAALRAGRGSAAMPKRGVDAAYFVAHEGNITIRLSKRACDRRLTHLAKPEGHEDVCTFTFSKPGHSHAYRLSSVSVRFRRPNLKPEAVLQHYYQLYQNARADETKPVRKVVWEFQVENDRFSARFLGDSLDAHAYRLELGARDLYESGTRYGRAVGRSYFNRYAQPAYIPHRP
ncbi:MAG: hypothetical protein KC549_00305 [Myxococcales bacterium]|nr:hypothetical protein [Myxococcales bacterium]MCB9546466.1 hypothetical protein [Myxococcales bacterium]